jgi:mRNA-degrading endonuclease RelE of RelBE toxin-antitoxin system
MLKEDPKCGKSLGKKIYKIRLKSSDIPKGKRSGYRVITYVIDESKKVRLLTIYAKPRKANISDKEIINIMQQEDIF